MRLFTHSTEYLKTMTIRFIYFLFIVFFMSLGPTGCKDKEENARLNEANAEIIKLTMEIKY